MTEKVYSVNSNILSSGQASSKWQMVQVVFKKSLIKGLCKQRYGQSFRNQQGMVRYPRLKAATKAGNRREFFVFAFPSPCLLGTEVLGKMSRYFFQCILATNSYQSVAVFDGLYKTEGGTGHLSVALPPF